MNAAVEPQRPDGVRPASYIAVLNEHRGVSCTLCADEQHIVPQLTPPVKRTNHRGSAFCTHIYTSSRGACFYCVANCVFPSSPLASTGHGWRTLPAFGEMVETGGARVVHMAERP